MSHNPIYPGFEWAQAFDFPDGFLQPGDGVRAEFRRSPADTAALTSITNGDGIQITGNRLFVSLTGDQTKQVAKCGARVVTNFVIVRSLVDIPIGQIVSIPIVILPTRPQ